MGSPFERHYELPGALITLTRVFGKGFSNHSLYTARNVESALTQQGWFGPEVLIDNLCPRPIKKGSSAQQLVENDRQRVLISGKTRAAHNLFWCHISGCTPNDSFLCCSTA